MNMYSYLKVKFILERELEVSTLILTPTLGRSGKNSRRQKSDILVEDEGFKWLLKGGVTRHL